MKKKVLILGFVVLLLTVVSAVGVMAAIGTQISNSNYTRAYNHGVSNGSGSTLSSDEDTACQQLLNITSVDGNKYLQCNSGASLQWTLDKAYDICEIDVWLAWGSSRNVTLRAEFYDISGGGNVQSNADYQTVSVNGTTKQVQLFVAGSASAVKHVRKVGIHQ